MSARDLSSVIAGKRLVVCVGSGGVGKTTTAAAIALQAAITGRKVLVLTIDPARRLANSLGLSRFGNDELRIDLSSLPEAKGELWAMMLDNQKTLTTSSSRSPPIRPAATPSSTTGSTGRPPTTSRAAKTTWRPRSCTTS